MMSGFLTVPSSLPTVSFLSADTQVGRYSAGPSGREKAALNALDKAILQEAGEEYAGQGEIQESRPASAASLNAVADETIGELNKNIDSDAELDEERAPVKVSFTVGDANEEEEDSSEGSSVYLTWKSSTISSPQDEYGRDERMDEAFSLPHRSLLAEFAAQEYEEEQEEEEPEEELVIEPYAEIPNLQQGGASPRMYALMSQNLEWSVPLIEFEKVWERLYEGDVALNQDRTSVSPHGFADREFQAVRDKEFASIPNHPVTDGSLFSLPKVIRSESEVTMALDSSVAHMHIGNDSTINEAVITCAIGNDSTVNEAVVTCAIGNDSTVNEAVATCAIEHDGFSGDGFVDLPDLQLRGLTPFTPKAPSLGLLNSPGISVRSSNPHPPQAFPVPPAAESSATLVSIRSQAAVPESTLQTPGKTLPPCPVPEVKASLPGPTGSGLTSSIQSHRPVAPQDPGPPVTVVPAGPAEVSPSGSKENDHVDPSFRTPESDSALPGSKENDLVDPSFRTPESDLIPKPQKRYTAPARGIFASIDPGLFSRQSFSVGPRKRKGVSRADAWVSSRKKGSIFID
ncbi:hypothetical protein BV898_14797 [Hypsibius exemplaris]|uniref:Uncharacterized protein n=1 Tax=Hypsibius exemplaris TaxID=2072580 RepID=A0A9X6NA63_HYPEX|nr:hypothetical protein BV898_14797 [Hypsibius exemplaris]